MKIAFINKYQNKVARGAETFVSELSKRLSINHEVDILTSVKLKKRYDVVIPTNGRLQAFIVRLITWISGSKMIISGQSGAGLDDRLNLYSFPDAFIALSEYQKDWAKRINPFVRVIRIPNGVDLSRFKNYDLRFKNKNKTVLSVGAFTKDKRHDLTIKAVAKLKDVKLIIVGGGGELKNKIYDLGIKNLGKNRFEIQSVPHEKMPKIYKKASVLAFPSVFWESFGIVIVEAMATGLPVVATNDPIRKEIVGEAGILVDPENTKDFSLSLRRALNTNWKDKPRKQAEKFNWDKIAKEYERLLQNIYKL